MPVFSGFTASAWPMNDVVVDAVLDVGRSVGDAKNALRVGLVLREQEGNVAVAVKVELAQLRDVSRR